MLHNRLYFGHLKVRFNCLQVKVPNVETTYWCSIHKLPSMLKKKHLIQFGPHIQVGNEPLVHHMELFHCEVDDSPRELPHWDGPCKSPDKPPELEVCKRVIAAWATGAQVIPLFFGHLNILFGELTEVLFPDRR